jgi:hypothetical protein
MSIEPIGFLTIIAGLFCLHLGVPALAIGTLIAATLGSASAMFVGGANVPPGHVMLAFLTLGAMTMRREAVAAIRSLHPNEPGFWLAFLVLYGVASAFFMPRIFAWTTEIVPLGASALDDTGTTIPLVPVSTNLTQSVYMMANLLCFAVCIGVASSRSGFLAVLNALIAYCIANTIFALVDVATYATGTQELLGFMRNARYTLHTDTEVAGMKRIAGSFTETSAFARSTLGVLGFMGTLWICGYRPVLTGIISAASLILLILSTSTTGVAVTPVVLCAIYATALLRLGPQWSTPYTFITVFLLPLIAAAALLLVLLNPVASDMVRGYLDLLVLGKVESESGLQRSGWNVTSFQNFLDSWGLGVGLGTARASSFAITMLATVGLPGLFFYLVFTLECFMRPRGAVGSLEADVAAAARNGALGLLAGDLLVSSVVDQGLFFSLLAAAAAVVRPRRTFGPNVSPLRALR